MKKQIPKGLYLITAENFSNSKDNVIVVKEMLDAGIKILQYRDKYKSKLEKFKQCEIIRKLTLDYECLFIINDDIDIALTLKSDGIHLGQNDLPITKAREIVGHNIIIGISTHSPEQAKFAVEHGADYIGVGPIYKTFTKENVVDPVGLEYLRFCMKNIKVPKMAIGGIKFSNLSKVCKYKPDNICMVTEITSAQDIKFAIKKAQEVIKND
ncbi:MAG: thiamine phosphate synthase [Endomicrobium sp.]|jgi:thiamine-phosphate pyrophosphorylase|nr:thiamine phosphate synthase [Endomicrobium sp.]